MKKLGLKGWLRGNIADDGTRELFYSEFSMKHRSALSAFILSLRLSQNVYKNVYYILRLEIHRFEKGHIVSPCNATTVRHEFRRVRKCLIKKIEI